MSQSGKVHKVNMFEVTNLNAYPFEGKYTKDGISHVDRRGDDAGINTGSAQQNEQKVQGDGQKSYRIDTLLK